MVGRYLAFACMLLILAVGQVSALSLDTVIQGTIGSLDLHAEANWTGSSWLYQYTLSCTNNISVVHIFSVGNPGKSSYTSASNDGGFANPVWNSSQAALQWTGASLERGQSATFSYESLFEPATTHVSALVVDGGTYGQGQTLGMSKNLADNVVPEAGTLSLAAGGLLGLVSGTRLRRSRRKN